MQRTIKGYIIYETWTGETEGRFRFQDFKPVTSSEHYTQVLVCEHEVTFDCPEDFDPREAQVAALRKTQERVRAEMSARINELQAQINKLLALEMA